MLYAEAVPIPARKAIAATPMRRCSFANHFGAATVMVAVKSLARSMVLSIVHANVWSKVIADWLRGVLTAAEQTKAGERGAEQCERRRLGGHDTVIHQANVVELRLPAPPLVEQKNGHRVPGVCGWRRPSPRHLSPITLRHSCCAGTKQRPGSAVHVCALYKLVVPAGSIGDPSGQSVHVASHHCRSRGLVDGPTTRERDGHAVWDRLQRGSTRNVYS